MEPLSQSRRPKLAALAVVVTALAAIAASLTNRPVNISADTSLDAEEQSFMSLINNYRAEQQLPPLIIDPSLQDAAEWMSTDMGVEGYFSHTDSLGRSPWDRMCDFGYCHNTWMGENIAAGYVSGASVFQGWRESAGHNANMLGEHYRVMGLARVYTQGSPFGWYWTNDFGGHIAESSPPPAPTDTVTPTPIASTEPSQTPQLTPTPTPTPTPTLQPSATPRATPTSTVPTEPADVDCNQVVSGADSLHILHFLAGLSASGSGDCPDVGEQGDAAPRPAGGAYPHGDLDCDRTVNVTDAVVILRALATAAPVPDCPA